ncbi:MAG TPA: hypothetical protein VEO55_11095, partial [Candidatus Dormibacteraeota bacterium]|nr:hypothetical protein [Candidatus Dormibacteraeota bacterium]
MSARAAICQLASRPIDSDAGIHQNGWKFMRKFLFDIRSHLIVVTLVAMGLCGCASRLENREQLAVAAPAASSESATSRDQNSAVLESFSGEYDSHELSSYLNDVARRLTPKSQPVTLKVVVLDSPIVNVF